MYNNFTLQHLEMAIESFCSTTLKLNIKTRALSFSKPLLEMTGYEKNEIGFKEIIKKKNSTA